MTAETRETLTALCPAPESSTLPKSLLDAEAIAALINRFADSLQGEGRFYVDVLTPVYGKALIEQLAAETSEGEL